jgi:hypothetical protein
MPAVLRLPSASGRITPHNHPGRVPSGPGSAPQSALPKLCQNPIHLECRELLFEREQLPQVVDIRHIRIESMERLEPANILRNQQVAGSIPARFDDVVCLPPDYKSHRSGMRASPQIARPAAQERIETLMERGFHKPGDAKNRLGYYVGQLGR